MAARPISSRVHGVLDCADAATLMAAPAALGLRGTRAGRILGAFGAAHAGLAAVTRYELGLVKLVPYRAHLAIDGLAAIGLAASPWMAGTARRGPRHWLPHVAFAASELGVTALSDPTGRGADVRRTMTTAGEAVRPSARIWRTDPDEREPQLAHPSELETVFPEGAKDRFSRGAFGERERRRVGGVGSGTGPGSSPPVGGQQA